MSSALLIAFCMKRLRASGRSVMLFLEMSPLPLVTCIVVASTTIVMTTSLAAQVNDPLPSALDGFYVEISLDSSMRELRSVNVALTAFTERTGGAQPCLFIVSCDATSLDERIMKIWGMADGVPWIVDTVMRVADTVLLAGAEGERLRFFGDGLMIAQGADRGMPLRYVRVARDRDRMDQHIRSLTLAGTYRKDDDCSCTFTLDGRYIQGGDTLLYNVRYEANDGRHDVLEVNDPVGLHGPVLYEIERNGAVIVLHPIVVDEESYERDAKRRSIRLMSTSR